MTLKSDTKFEDKLTNDLENNMRNFANIHQQHLKVGTRNWDFYGVLLSQVENV